MNQIQEAIARITGVSEAVELVKSEATEQIEGLRQEQLEAADVMEHLVSDNNLLQRQIEDLDYLNLFELQGVKDIIPMGDRKATLMRLRRLRHDNPIAKQAVKLTIRFTLGKGVQYTLAAEHSDEAPVGANAPDPVPSTGSVPPPPSKILQLPRTARAPEAIVQPGDKDPIQEIIDSFWNDADNKLAFTSHHGLQQFLDEIVTDGEKFYACFEDPSAPYLKITEIPIEEITDIIYDPNNRLKPVYYRRSYTEQKYNGKDDRYEPSGRPVVKYYLDYRITEEELVELDKNIKIPKSKIVEDVRVRHIMINEIWTKRGKRGLSELYSSRDWFKVFREFMEGRASINNAAQAISYVRKIKGGPTAVASFGGKFGGLAVGDNDNNPLGIRQLTKPAAGAIYDANEAVDLSWMKTDTGAVNAKEDARMLLMAGGAGVGTMVHYFGEGGDANLATAQSMELPMVKSYEDWQQFIEDTMNGWFEYLLRVALVDEDKIKDAIKRIGWIFPPIISQDVVKFTTAWSQIVRDIAPNNPAVKRQAIRAVLSIMGVPNINALMPEIEAEMVAAEAKREAMNQAMLDQTPPPVFGGNGKTTIPNEGASPNLKALAAGKVKAANGPKPA